MSVYLRPADLAEALLARREHPGFAVLAGGTDLMVGGDASERFEGVIDLFGLPELTSISAEEDGTVVIGAACTYSDLLASPLLQERAPLLLAACSEIGAVQIRNRGTIGGNIATSSPVGDTLPVLLALDAELELRCEDRSRRVPYRDFCTGYRVTALRDDELITAIRLPPLPPGTRQLWQKVGTRRAQSISKVMFAGVARVENGVIADLRLAFGAVADRPIRAYETEKALVGMPLGDSAVRTGRAALADELTPIDDVRSTAAYRQHVSGNILARFLTALAAEPDHQVEPAPSASSSMPIQNRSRVPWRLLFFILLTGGIIAGVMFSLDLFEEHYEFREETTSILDKLSHGLAGDVYDEASFPFRETLIYDRFDDLVDRMNRTLGKFKHVLSVDEVESHRSIAGKTVLVRYQIEYEHAVTQAEISYVRGDDNKWRLLGLDVMIPETLEDKAEQLEAQYERIKAPDEVVLLVGDILDGLHKGEIDRVYEKASPPFKETVSRDRLAAIEASRRDQLGSFVRLLAVLSSAQDATKKRAHVHTLLEYEKVKTTATFDFIKVDQRWALLAFKVAIPEPLLPARERVQ